MSMWLIVLVGTLIVAVMETVQHLMETRYKRTHHKRKHKLWKPNTTF